MGEIREVSVLLRVSITCIMCHFLGLGTLLAAQEKLGFYQQAIGGEMSVG